MLPSQAVKFWSTPRANEQSQQNSRDSGVALSRQSKLWTTPQAHDSQGCGNPARVGRFGTKHGGKNLNDDAALWSTRLWPTPSAGTHNDGEDPDVWRARAEKLKKSAKNGNGAGTPLPVAAAAVSQGRSLTSLLGPLPPTTSTPGEKSSRSTRQLNPRFVEWLMGFPIGWTDSALSVMPSFRQWQLTHGARSGGG